MSFAFNNPVPRNTLPFSHEQSRLASLRESNSVLKTWKKTQASNARADMLTSLIAQLQRQIARVPTNQQSLSNLHPFKLYQFPTWMRRFHPTDEHRRLKVRFGGISFRGTGGDYGMEIPKGCDYDGAYPDPSSTFWGPDAESYISSTEIPPNDSTAISSSWHEIIVPDDGTEITIWISLCGAAQGTAPTGDQEASFIFYGTSATGCTSLWDGNVGNDVWPAFGYDDPYHFVIGKAWYNTTDTYQAIGLNYSQGLFENIRTNVIGKEATHNYGCCISRFRGEYDASQYYWTGDEVLKTGTDFTQRYALFPKGVGDAGVYWYGAGPVHGVDPASNSPEPWLLVGNFPNVTTEIWATGAYDSSKYYMRKV